MYNNKISMATLAGHGLGGKIAFSAACHHFDRVTGYCGFDTTPMNQYYFQPFHELRANIKSLTDLRLDRPFEKISLELKNIIKCPKWRKIF
jgi:pimeloyl-ACP methyl ester carboxylesterase